MPGIKRLSVTVATAADGSATARVGGVDTNGLLQQIVYVKDSTTPYDNTVTFTITEDDTGRALLSTGAIASSTNFMPRDGTVTTANAAALYAAVGTAVNSPIPVSGAIKIVLANGGNAKVGKFYIYLA